MHAIVLAGGKGERLRPYTEDRPKPMVEVLGIPIVGYHLQWLRAQGVTDVVIACGFRHDVIEGYFGAGEQWDLRIRYAVEETPLGRGGALRRAMAMLPHAADMCAATNGDILTNVPLRSVVAAHRASANVATVVLTPLVSPYGIVEAEGDRVTGFREKPELPYWINAGIYVLSREIEPMLPERGDHEESTFPQLAAARRLGAYHSRAYWRAVDTIKDLSEVARDVEQGALDTSAGDRP